LRESARARVAAVTASALVLLAGLVVTTGSRAQRVAAGEPLTVVLGEPSGLTSMARLDGRRTNLSRDLLPTASLRMIWSRQTRPMTHAPLVAADGTVIVLSTDGELEFINPDGTTQGHAQMGPGPMSDPVLLPDGVLVAANSAGDVVGVRPYGLQAQVAFRSHVVEPGSSAGIEEVAANVAFQLRGQRRGRTVRHRPPAIENGMRISALPLDDGGLALAWGRELLCLDAEGVVRTRATSSVAPASALLAVDRGGSPSAAFVTETGEVYEWALAGGADPVRARGSFGGGVEGNVLVEDERHLLGIVRGTRLVSLDLVTGVAETRATAGIGGLFTDAFALAAPPPRSSGAVLVQEIALSGTHVVSIDREGHATPFAVLLSSQGMLSLPDAGAGSLPPTGTMLFVDPAGNVAYGAVDGHVGVASMTTKHELGSLPCGAPGAGMTGTAFGQGARVAMPFAGMVPAGPGAFVVACETGIVSLVRGVVE